MQFWIGRTILTQQHNAIACEAILRDASLRLRMMAIEKNGVSVTMASSNSPQVTFDADGVARTETTNRGRTIRTTATATRTRRDQLRRRPRE
jgi:hypothetical protein